MNIEDFKGIVADYQVGDELKLEALCSAWNREVDRFEQEEVETQLRDRIAELENQLENNEQVLAGYRNELVKQNEMLVRLDQRVAVLRQALQEGC